MSEHEDRALAAIVAEFGRALGKSLRTAQRHRKENSSEWRRFLEKKTLRSSGSAGPIFETPTADVEQPSPDAAPGVELILGAGREGGVEVAQARALQNAAYGQLQLAYKSGRQSDIAQWSAVWKDASETVRKALLADRQIQTQSGDMLSRSQMAEEISLLLETLRTMRSTLGARVACHLVGEGEGLMERVRVIVNREAEKEEQILRTIGELGAPADVVAKLADT